MHVARSYSCVRDTESQVMIMSRERDQIQRGRHVKPKATLESICTLGSCISEACIHVCVCVCVYLVV